MKKINSFLLIVSILFVYACATPQEVTKTQIDSPNLIQNEWLNLDTVKAGEFDTGKMWTFENAPIDYWEKTYGFRASEDWLTDVQMSSLKFASWCTASFVSEDGLIMTNHHCIDFVSSLIEQEGEDIAENGFYAETLEDERRIANVYVDQLAVAEDVTEIVLEAYELGKTDDEKQSKKNETIADLEKQYSEETGLICKVTELYNGGSYSMYCYRRYSDVRVVYFNPRNVGLYGGDPDNFTYPRYNADFAFLRVYDDEGNPLQTANYFKWSLEGAQLDEPLFVVGNPGSTQRLKTVSQLEYFRDYTYRNTSFLLNEYLVKLYSLMNEFPEKAEAYEGTAFFVSNSAKVYREYLKGLRNPYFMQRKRVFEKEFQNKVNSSPELKKRFGHVWSAIDESNQQLRKTAAEFSAFTLSNQTKPQYFNIADELLKLADQLSKPEGERDAEYKGEELKSTIESIWPANFDEELEKSKLELAIDFMELNLGDQNRWVKSFKDGKSTEDAVEILLSKSYLSSKDKVTAFASSGAAAINDSDDPIIQLRKYAVDKLAKIAAERAEILGTQNVLEDELGLALYKVYGNSIPPDATFTLRINDGELKKVDYNGTEAPVYTTFYGMYDRYYSHMKEYPWDLPENWKNPGPDFDLSTPYNFISTNDITGGSSGSPVINKNKEVVGLAFDGNIESIVGNFLYNPSQNRMVSVSSQGIHEILNDLVKAKRLANELLKRKIE